MTETLESAGFQLCRQSVRLCKLLLKEHRADERDMKWERAEPWKVHRNKEAIKELEALIVCCNGLAKIYQGLKGVKNENKM